MNKHKYFIALFLSFITIISFCNFYFACVKESEKIENLEPVNNVNFFTIS